MHSASKNIFLNAFILCFMVGQLMSLLQVNDHTENHNKSLINKFSLPWGPYVISRAGRGSPSKYWYNRCCPIGLKSEISPDRTRPTKHTYCKNKCCDHLEEITHIGVDGTRYTYCKHKDPQLNQVLKEEIRHLSHDEVNKLIKLFEIKDRNR